MNIIDNILNLKNNGRISLSARTTAPQVIGDVHKSCHLLGVFPMKTQKQCDKCLQMKDLSAFYRGNGKAGYRSPCKQCRKEREREYTRSHKEAISLKGKKYRQKHREECRRQKRRYHQSHPERQQCKDAVQWAKKTGILMVGSCADCGMPPEDIAIQAHHTDYEKPLDVVWLCASCHQARHISIEQSK